ncbi:heparan-alpha-glucosaminide N-acetyltransferase domain-containing protein [Ferruginibacter paludis]|uniref:acyltransferase family protein n=1 Tax=Ferruginibacter paludis TaxID=1310417 RepID=UPI0025B31C31|nr:heparan-alpha-glucosaminide N-acetyltransferase domain-containing protein [Ferruginibacter paludis]MDN3659418.1 heparan-alpha-glucosaminide N-acetyltransferase domain-containing protein [Ferruginibacter paludis]
MIIQTKRLISLDALRGFTIAAMIMVNYPGSEDAVYFTLRHTEWNGLSFTDQVAPYFLFFVGASIALAYSRRLQANVSRSSMYKKIFTRSLKIYAVGMFLNLMPAFDFHNIRWTGTLQRIAVVFFISAIIYLNTNWKQQAWIAAITLVLYWLLITCIPMPGYGKVMLEPGVNIVALVDNHLLPGKMWRGNWDPESILTTFTSVVSCITGMLAGHLMLSDKSPDEKINWLMTAGVFLSITGYFWGLVFPVNENLWTSSFVLVTSGFASLLFGALYFLVDIKGKIRGTLPGIIFGANAITIYFLADVWALFFYVAKFGGSSLNEKFVNSLSNAGADPKLASLIYALLFVCINFIPAWWLYKRKLFIKL